MPLQHNENLEVIAKHQDHEYEEIYEMWYDEQASKKEHFYNQELESSSSSDHSSCLE